MREFESSRPSHGVGSLCVGPGRLQPLQQWPQDGFHRIRPGPETILRRRAEIDALMDATTYEAYVTSI